MARLHSVGSRPFAAGERWHEAGGNELEQARRPVEVFEQVSTEVSHLETVELLVGEEGLSCLRG
jgi:hypothetical protein